MQWGPNGALQDEKWGPLASKLKNMAFLLFHNFLLWPFIYFLKTTVATGAPLYFLSQRSHVIQLRISTSVRDCK